MVVVAAGAPNRLRRFCAEAAGNCETNNIANTVSDSVFGIILTK